MEQAKKQRHVWTEIAPELSPDIENAENTKNWKWCIRCGALKLSNEVFHPSKNQKLVIQTTARKNDPGYSYCNE